MKVEILRQQSGGSTEVKSNKPGAASSTRGAASAVSSAGGDAVLASISRPSKPVSSSQSSVRSADEASRLAVKISKDIGSKGEQALTAQGVRSKS